MIQHFAYINDSTGELDWLAPYLIEVANLGETTMVFVALPRLKKTEKPEVFASYFDNSDVRSFFSTKFCDLSLRFEFFVERVVAKVIKNHRLKVLLNNLISTVLSYIIVQNAPQVKLLYLDYNLKEKAFFKKIKRKNPNAKVVIFPHSTAFMTSTNNTPKPPPARIDCSLFLECTRHNSRFEVYNDKISVVGSPTLDLFRNQPRQLSNDRAVLFLTRRNDPDFAMDETATLRRFKKLLDWCNLKRLEIHIKHHPRDTQLDKWRNLYGDYNVTEIQNDIGNLSTDYIAVFATYTSAVVLFASKAIPTFDFTGYAGDTKKLSYHYLDENNEITHELIEFGITKRLSNDDFIDFAVLAPVRLAVLGGDQKRVVDEVFPNNSIKNIIREVKKLEHE